jgi:hypothetical protein
MRRPYSYRYRVVDLESELLATLVVGIAFFFDNL